MNTDELNEAADRLLTEQGVKQINKEDSLICKILNPIVGLWNPNFKESTTMTLGDTVYMPAKTRALARRWKIKFHELVHVLDQRKTGPKYVLRYGMPQWFGLLGLLAFGAFWNLWCLVFLLFLGFLAPLPSKGRTHWERRGYAMSWACNYWRYGSVSQETIDWTISRFTGWSYYKMWPNQADMEAWANEIIRNLEKHDHPYPAEAELEGDPYSMIRALFREEKPA